MAFWKKFYKSKYTGAEIDAAVAKAGTVPTVTSADEGKALVVDEEGTIVPGEVGGFTEPTVELSAAESATILTPLMSIFAAAGDTLTGYRGAISTGTDTIIEKVLPYCNGSYSRLKITFTGLDGIFYTKLTVLNNDYAHFDSDFNYYEPVGGSPCLFKLGVAIPLKDAGQLNVALYVQKVNLAT